MRYRNLFNLLAHKEKLRKSFSCHHLDQYFSRRHLKILWGSTEMASECPPTNAAQTRFQDSASVSGLSFFSLVVVGPSPCSDRFFTGYSGFPLSSKLNISNSIWIIVKHFIMNLRLGRLSKLPVLLTLNLNLFQLFSFINALFLDRMEYPHNDSDFS